MSVPDLTDLKLHKAYVILDSVTIYRAMPVDVPSIGISVDGSVMDLLGNWLSKRSSSDSSLEIVQ